MFHPTIRRCVFWAHLVAGLSAGLVILVLAVTGLLMSFETQIIDRAERAMVRERSKGDTVPLSAAEMIAAFEKAGIKGRPTSLGYSGDKDAPVIFIVDKEEPDLFHPTTGEYLGKGAARTRKLFKTALTLHRWLTLPGGPQKKGESGTTWKDIGGQITAAGALVFLFLLVSGLVIWIPKKRSKKAFAAVLTVQRRLKGRARDWNWHNVAGFWASPLILTICVTGLIMAYPWANRMLFASFGETPPDKKQQRSIDGQVREQPLVATRLDALAAFAKQKVPAWESIVMEIPSSELQPLVVTVTDAGRGRPDRRDKFTLDPGSLEIVKHEAFSNLKPGQRARQYVRWLHTGELGGPAGQLLAALGSLAAIILVWTGFALAYRRFSPKHKASAV